MEAMQMLRERYLHWVGMDDAGVLRDREEAAEDIRAMQLVVRMERDPAPSWHRAVGLAASAAAQLCVDHRSVADGPWAEAMADYCRGHIRKVTRRARGAAWAAVHEVPGITLTSADTEVRALVPDRVVDLDRRVAKLQVGGTDVPRDSAAPTPVGPYLRLWYQSEPAMSLGKCMAQAGHAGMLAVALGTAPGEPDNSLSAWISAGCPAWAGFASAQMWDELTQRLGSTPAQVGWSQHHTLAVRDAGFTEVDPGTVTVLAELVS